MKKIEKEFKNFNVRCSLLAVVATQKLMSAIGYLPTLSIVRLGQNLYAKFLDQI